MAIVAIMLVCPLSVTDCSDAQASKTLNLNEITTSNLYNNGVVTLDQDYNISGTLSTSVTIDGGTEKYTLYGMMKLDPTLENGEEMLTVTLKNLVLNGNNNTQYGIHSQNQGEKNLPVRELDLTMENCTVKNFTAKGMYITNSKNLNIDSCTFENVATTDETIARGDHAIDVVLAGVTDSEISITNNTFIGNTGHNASIQLQQRGGPDSGIDDNGDIKFNTAATIKNAYIAGNDFSQAISGADIRLGSWPSVDPSDARTYSKAFDATIIAKGETTVATCTVPGSDGTYQKDRDLQVGLSDTSVMETAGGTTSSNGKTTGTLDFDIKSGSGTLFGTLPSYMEITVSKGATATVLSLKNEGSIHTYDGNLSGLSNLVGNPVDNTQTYVPPTEDEDLPPFIPAQSADEDDTVTIVACAAAAAVAAIMAVFLIVERRER